MRPPETTYSGYRVSGPQNEALGVRVCVNGKPLSIAASQAVVNHNHSGFEWGYSGSGPAQLALALVLDATGDPHYARRAYHWFKWAVVNNWGNTWSITAGEIRAWLIQFESEIEGEETPLDDAEASAVPVCIALRRCHVTNHTKHTQHKCIAACVGCVWLLCDEEPPICSRCADEQEAALLAEMGGRA